MAYNLPPPWDPGFALPSNVRDEGLQRRGFVTRQAPRGTYDDPAVGTGGYAVPKYVLSEGYGQGVKVSRWAQRGRYDIPVPNYLNARPIVAQDRRTVSGARVITMDALGDVALPTSFQRFGQQAATAVLAAVQKAPPAERRATLKAILDRVDPTLYGRTMTLAPKLARTMSASAAVHAALAQSMSQGAARELLEVGRTGKKPSARSVLGLGCYGVSACVALGDVSALRAAILPIRETKVAATAQPTAQPQVGNCSSDGTLYWTGTSWRRKGAKDVCTGIFNPTVVSSSGSAGGVTVSSGGTVLTGTVASAPTLAEIGMTFIKAGPFTLQDKPGSSVTYSKSAMSAEQIKTLYMGLAAASAKIFGGFANQPPTNILLDLADWGWDKAFVARKAAEGDVPIARFVHPTSGKTCVIWAKLIGTKAAPQVQLRWGLYEGAISALAGAVIDLVATIVAPVVDALEVVGDLACRLANAPNAAQTGAAIGVAAGAGASVGTAGAQIVAGACAEPPPATPAETTQTGSSILPLAIAGGAIAVVALYFTRKK